MALWDSLRGPLEGLGSPLEGHIGNASKDTQANYQHLPEHLLKHFLCGVVVVLLVVVVVVVVHVGPYRSSGGSWGVLGRSLEVAGGVPGGRKGFPGGSLGVPGGSRGVPGGVPGRPRGVPGGAPGRVRKHVKFSEGVWGGSRGAPGVILVVWGGHRDRLERWKC